LFDSIRERLNATETREEAEEIFNEAVVELDKYGLLGWLSVKQAQRLVTGGYQDSRIMNLLERIITRYEGTFDNNSNFFCLFTGEIDFSSVIPFFGMQLNRLFSPSLLLGFPMLLLVNLFYLCRDLYLPLPFVFGNGITLGSHYSSPATPGEWDNPSEGWITTFGLLGRKKWEGNNMYGQLLPIVRFLIIDFNGASGFTGLRIRVHLYGDTNYLGCASIVRIDYKKPWL